MSLNPIHIMSLNLRFGLAKDGPNRWEIRKKAYPHLFETGLFDFISFQEANDFQIQFLSDHLNEYRFVGKRDPAPPFWQNNVIFFHKKWSLSLHKHFFLSHVPDLPSRFGDSKWPRQCTLAIFESGHRKIACINTHFDFQTAVQVKSAKLILNWLNVFAPGLPTIVVGDFNCEPESPCNLEFTHSSTLNKHLIFKNVFTQPFPATFHGFSGTLDGPHIDWILYRGNIRLQQADIITTSFNNLYPSDHYPVRAVFDWI